MLEEIGHPFARGEPVYDVTFENVQAGLRTDYLFRIANQRGGIVLGTGDLSELALGWATYGVGDQMSHYNVNGGVPKTLIQHLIRWVISSGQFDDEVDETLAAILDTEISPELVPGEELQSTESKVGPYALQDFTLFYMLRYGFRPSKIGFLAWHAWRDATRASGRPDFPEAKRVAYDLPEIRALAGGLLPALLRASRSSSARRCRTGRRSPPAARCRRAATGARRPTARPRPGCATSSGGTRTPGAPRNRWAALTVQVAGRSPMTRGMAREPKSWTRGWSYAAVAAGLTALFGTAWGYAESSVPMWNLAWTAAAVAATAGALAARSSLGAEARRQWTWWSAACGCWLAGQIAWNTYGVFETPPSPNPADLGWWGFAVLMIAGLLAPVGASPACAALAAVEAIPLIVAVMAATGAWLWDDAAASALPLSARVSVFLYPVLYVSAAVLTLQATVAGSLVAATGRASRLVLVGVVVTALAFIGWSPTLFAGDYVVGETLIDPLWVLGLLCIGGGGLVAARDGAAPEAPRSETDRRGGLLPARSSCC